MNRRTFRWLVLLPLITGGCGTAEPLSPADRGAGSSTPIMTDAGDYVVRQQASGMAVDIVIRFQNQSTSRMYIVNCHSILAPVLEKRVGEDWVPYWRGITPLCLSSPIVVRPGASIERELRIWGALPGTNQAPQWESADVEGTYRIVLGSVVYRYDDRRQGFGDTVPLELRVSNEFTLRR
jgi:hypothetical protein